MKFTQQSIITKMQIISIIITKCRTLFVLSSAITFIKNAKAISFTLQGSPLVISRTKVNWKKIEDQLVMRLLVYMQSYTLFYHFEITPRSNYIFL
jgi:hypothetical protein